MRSLRFNLVTIGNRSMVKAGLCRPSAFCSEGGDEWQDMCVLEILPFPSQCPWIEVVSDEMQFGNFAVKLTGAADDTLVGPDW